MQVDLMHSYFTSTTSDVTE